MDFIRGLISFFLLFLIKINLSKPTDVHRDKECNRVVYKHKRVPYEAKCKGWWWKQKNCIKYRHVKEQIGLQCICCPGWKGTCGHCTPVCEKECNPKGGKCTAPNTCECNQHYIGKQCQTMVAGNSVRQTRSSCFVVRKHDEVSGSIQTANFNERSLKSASGLTCSHRLEAPKDRKIVINLRALQVKEGYRCNGDTLDIYGSEGFIGRFCGNYKTLLRREVTTNSDFIMLAFSTKTLPSAEGIYLEYRFVEDAKLGECWKSAYVDEDYTARCGLFRRSCQKSRRVVNGVKCACCNGFEGQCGSCTPICLHVEETAPGTGGIIATGNYKTGGNYPSGQHCKRTISSLNEDYVVRVRFTKLDLRGDSKCSEDYVEIYEGSSPLGKFCGTRVVRNEIITKGKELTVAFRSNEEEEGGGFVLKYEIVRKPTKRCIDVVWTDQLSGKIVSGNIYEGKNEYWPDLLCSTSIKTFPNLIFHVVFTFFDLEDSPNCARDNVQLYEGLRKTRTLCGSAVTLPSQGHVETTRNILTFIFKTDSSNQRRGFRADFEIHPRRSKVPCWRYTEIPGPTSTGASLMTGNVPTGYNYNNNMNCKRVIKTHAPIRWTFLTMDIEESPGCRRDYVELYDDHSLLGRYCGQMVPESITTQSNRLTVLFKSDAFDTRGGFKAKYDVIRKSASTEDCFWKLQHNKFEGQISSGNYRSRNLNYYSNMKCSHKLIAPSGMVVQLTFEELDIESSENCEADSLVLNDGNDMLREYCGSELPSQLTTVSNTLELIMTSNNIIEGRGFKAYYRYIENVYNCWQKNQNTQGGDISLDNTGGTYAPNMRCSHRIIAPSRHLRVYLRFVSFAVERSENCKYDWLNIFDGEKLINKYCGFQNPLNAFSTNNSIRLEFNSDHTLQFGGFFAIFSYHPRQADIKCTVTKCLYNRTETPMKGTVATANFECQRVTYWSDMSCSTALKAPAGFVVKLQFLEFDVEDHYQCDYDSLRIYEQQTATSRRLQRGIYCGDAKPPDIISKTNLVIIHFRSDASNQRKGFKLVYEFVRRQQETGNIAEKNPPCGLPIKQQFKVVGGVASSRGQWPWLASLQLKGTHHCGATLIGDRWVLTAAHCVSKRTSKENLFQWTVALGAHKRLANEGHEQIRHISNILVHKNYRSSTHVNDIALIKLKIRVKFTNLVIPICLPIEGTKFSGSCVVAGWGRTEEGVAGSLAKNVQHANVDIVENTQCDRSFGGGTVFDEMICAGKIGGKDSCQGDSGGPLVCGKGTYTMAGIVSFGRGCGRQGFPGVYTRVSEYKSWLDTNMKLNP